jgi:AcrR family transcriptional regulator
MSRGAERSERRDTLTRERVLRAGVALADESGIESLTMRELGRRLGVEAASLYNHVSGKDDLLDGMTDLVVGEIDVPSDGVEWKEAMSRRTVSARAVFSRHPWASGLIDSREQTGSAQLSYADRVLGTLLQAGFSPTAAAHAFLVLDSYIYGFQRQRSSLSLADDDVDPSTAEAFAAALPPDSYPSLMRVASEFAVKPYDDAAAFDFGLGLILDGLENLLAACSDSSTTGIEPTANGTIDP